MILLIKQNKNRHASWGEGYVVYLYPVAPQGDGKASMSGCHSHRDSTQKAHCAGPLIKGNCLKVNFSFSSYLFNKCRKLFNSLQINLIRKLYIEKVFVC